VTSIPNLHNIPTVESASAHLAKIASTITAMSLPAEAPVLADSSVGDEKHPELLSFTLIIVSPSTGVTSPLTFTQLPAVTTVSQLKAKIRDALPSKPLNEGQRLIHRGRLLARETESMLEIFGEETVSTSRPTFHS
jgi:hypothetical protein